MPAFTPHAGIEVGVASTKSFVSQLTILTLMALLMGRSRDLSYEEGATVLRGLEKLPDQIRETLQQSERIREMARKYSRLFALPLHRQEIPIPDCARRRLETQRNRLHPRGGLRGR